MNARCRVSALETFGAVVTALAILGALVVDIEPATAVVANPAPQVDITVAGSALAGVTTSPSALQPSFASDVHDYVIRCDVGTNAVALALTATPGGSITVGGQSGAVVQVPASIAEGGAFVLHATDPAAPLGPPTEYWIRCLPHDFPKFDVNEPRAVPAGWYLTGTLMRSTSPTASGTYAMILNQRGTPVWYAPAPNGAINVELLRAHQIAWVPNLGPGVGAIADGAYSAFDFDTGATTLITPPVPPLDPHELLQLPNGHRMVISSPLRSGFDASFLGSAFSGITTIVDCVVQEMDANGGLVSQWRMSDHVDIHEALITPQLAGTARINNQLVADVFHCNSVDVDPATGDQLVSARSLSSVFRISHTDGHIIWKLGGSAPTNAATQHLAFANDPEGTISGQHDVRFHPNGHISLYDNHTRAGGAARGVEYAIDTGAGTATPVFAYPAPDGQPAEATGSFRRSADGNDNIVGWGFKEGSGFTEFDGTGNVLMTLTYTNGEAEYRVIKYAAAAFDANLLRHSVAAVPTPGWDSLGGTTVGAPSGASWTSSRVDVFARGVDNQLHHLVSASGAAAAWEALGGVLTSAPASASWGTGRLDAFVRGTDNALHTRWFDGGNWSASWANLGGTLTSAPAVAAWAPGRLDVFVRGTDNALWHRYYNGQWYGWENLGGTLSTAPAVASWSPGRLDVIAGGSDNSVYHLWFDGRRWSGWENLGGTLTASPAASSWGAGRLDVFVRGTDHNLSQRYFDNGRWSAWGNRGVFVNSDLGATARGSGRLDLFVQNPDATVGTRSFGPGGWSPASG